MLKGVLEGCVLALIGRGETYGYELAGTLAACGLSGVAEGTFYPLLMRLEKKGLITSTYRASDMGPRRKYYRITDAGMAEIGQFAREFDELQSVVASVLGQCCPGGPKAADGDAPAEGVAPTGRVRGVLKGDYSDVVEGDQGAHGQRAARGEKGERHA